MFKLAMVIFLLQSFRALSQELIAPPPAVAMDPVQKILAYPLSVPIVGQVNKIEITVGIGEASGPVIKRISLSHPNGNGRFEAKEVERFCIQDPRDCISYKVGVANTKSYLIFSSPEDAQPYLSHAIQLELAVDDSKLLKKENLGHSSSKVLFALRGFRGIGVSILPNAGISYEPRYLVNKKERDGKLSSINILQPLQVGRVEVTAAISLTPDEIRSIHSRFISSVAERAVGDKLEFDTEWLEDLKLRIERGY